MHFDDPGLAYGGACRNSRGGWSARGRGPAHRPITPISRTGAGYVDEVKKLADDQRDKDRRSPPSPRGDYKLVVRAHDPARSARQGHSPLIDMSRPGQRRRPPEARGGGRRRRPRPQGHASARPRRGSTPASRTSTSSCSTPGASGPPVVPNMIYAPGTLTGYGAKTLSGRREAIEQRRFDERAPTSSAPPL